MAASSTAIAATARGTAQGVATDAAVIDGVFDHIPWMIDAKCLDADPEAFFPEKGGSTREAKRICGACAVREQCLEYALANDERFGIWGGMSERERRRLKRLAS